MHTGNDTADFSAARGGFNHRDGQGIRCGDFQFIADVLGWIAAIELKAKIFNQIVIENLGFRRGINVDFGQFGADRRILAKTAVQRSKTPRKRKSAKGDQQELSLKDRYYIYNYLKNNSDLNQLLITDAGVPLNQAKLSSSD